MKWILITVLVPAVLFSCSNQGRELGKRKIASEFFHCEFLYTKNEQVVFDEIDGLDANFGEGSIPSDFKIKLSQKFGGTELDQNSVDLDDLDFSLIKRIPSTECPAVGYSGFIRGTVVFRPKTLRANASKWKFEQMNQKGGVPFLLTCNGERISNSCF